MPHSHHKRDKVGRGPTENGQPEPQPAEASSNPASPSSGPDTGRRRTMTAFTTATGITTATTSAAEAVA